VPAFGSEWYPRLMYISGSPEFQHHVRTYGQQRNFGYKNFVPLFHAERFDAQAWAKLFAESGARYVVPVAEHHDGFAMYDSELTDWCASKMGPHRDIIGELSSAIRREGLHFGVSSHRAEHYFFLTVGAPDFGKIRATLHSTGLLILTSAGLTGLVIQIRPTSTTGWPTRRKSPTNTILS
jgi:alpha-L-fucosidase